MNRVLILLPLLFACASEPEAPAPAAPAPAAETLAPPVARAVELAEAVEARPGEASAALAEKNGTQAELEGLLYDIAADPALTESYAKAMGR